MQEKRQTPRIETDLLVTSPYSALPPNCHITNLSTSGAFIQTTDPLPVDTTFTLNVHLPGDSATVTIHASVIWSRSTHSVTPPGMGAQFTSIATDQKNKLAEFLRQQIWSDAKISRDPL